MKAHQFFIFPVLIVLVLFLFACVSVKDRPIGTKISVSTMFRRHMVLQSGKPVTIWGSAQPEKTLKVLFAGQEKTVTAGKDGSWSLILDPMEVSSEPRTMEIDYVISAKEKVVKDQNFKVTFDDVLVGEVWFCSGQSNMELGMAAIQNGNEELEDTNYPNIRVFFMGKDAKPFPVKNPTTVWIPCDRDIVATMGWKGFSAVAYIFGRKLHKDLNVPVGLIHSAFGGSAIQPWIPLEELKSTEVLKMFAIEVENANRKYEELRKKDKKAKHPFDGITEWDKLKPTTCYNAMVSPIKPYTIRGFLWYQGESNVGDGMKYADKMNALITGWRRVFNQGPVPFYMVQIAPYNYGSGDALPRMWEAQQACLSIENTGLALTIDVGDPKDIHPTRKKEVGERLALIALANAYGKTDVVFQGPVFREMKIENDKAIIYFDHAESGLVTKDGNAPAWFTIAGSNMIFANADARIEGNTIIVKSDKVTEPKAVRYAWSNVAETNLYNKEGLPAMPFRTDKY